MSGYVGRIKNTASQVVKAPVNPHGNAKADAKVKKGGDLRSGKQVLQISWRALNARGI